MPLPINKQKRDIVDLLQWAVNDELPKGRHVEQTVWRTILSYSESSSSRSFLGVRQRIQQISSGYVSGDPDEAAIVIARAVHEFNRVEYLSDEAVARSLLDDLINIDPPGIVGSPPPCVTAALGFRTNAAALLLNCAVLKRAPYLDHRFPRPMQVKRNNGRPLALRKDADGDLIEACVKNWRNDFVGEPRCPLEWGNPDIESVVEQRTEYTIWWHTLAALAKKLDGQLVRFIVTPPSLPACPWRTPPARQPTLWRGAA